MVSERIVQSVSVGPAEVLKPEKMLYILKEADGRNKVSLLREEDSD